MSAPPSPSPSPQRLLNWNNWTHVVLFEGVNAQSVQFTYTWRELVARERDLALTMVLERSLLSDSLWQWSTHTDDGHAWLFEQKMNATTTRLSDTVLTRIDELLSDAYNIAARHHVPLLRAAAAAAAEAAEAAEAEAKADVVDKNTLARAVIFSAVEQTRALVKNTQKQKSAWSIYLLNA
jgi:ribonuclease D